MEVHITVRGTCNNWAALIIACLHTHTDPGRDGGPLAKRWTNRSAPWRVTVPLENDQGQVIPNGDITLELSTVRWLTKCAAPRLLSSPHASLRLGREVPRGGN